MEKTNIAELLKDCPKDMELDCSIHTRPVIFNCVKMESDYPIRISSKDGFSYSLTYWGSIYNYEDAKCVIFPKGKTTWEGFQRPFKDGDIVFYNDTISIFKEWGDETLFRAYVCTYLYREGFCKNSPLFGKNIRKEIRLATEEEKQKLFQVIKDKGYKWNAEIKTLEKLIEPEFNVGDWIIRNNKYTGIPVKVIEFNGYYSCELNGEVVNLTRNDVHNNFHLWTIQDAQDGDVLFHSDSASNGIFIFKEISQYGFLQKVICYCDYDSEDGFCLGENHTCCWTDSKILRPATKEQCNLLFSKMKEAGYEWIAETKALEKVFPYNIGTKVWVKSDKEHKYLHTIVGISRNSFGNLEYEVKEEKTGIVVHYPKELLIPMTKEPTFKVGDRVRGKYTNNIYKISRITSEGYELTNGQTFTFNAENCYELVLDKFDISTLIPFKSKVLVRHNKDNKWTGSFFSFIDRDLHSHCYKFVTTADKSYPMMIPFKDNEHLLGKTDDCQDFYKTWE